MLFDKMHLELHEKTETCNICDMIKTILSKCMQKDIETSPYCIFYWPVARILSEDYCQCNLVVSPHYET